MKEKKVSRRQFVGGSLAAGAVLTQACNSFNIVPRSVLGGKPRHIAPSEKLNIAAIGIGGKGHSDLEYAMGENVIALCDVDQAYAAKAFALVPGARKYTDYREMIEKEKELDAVIVATPDHHHAPASILAMQHGLHVYCQKPLTHTVYEARRMRETAKKYGVVTQMGNQGTSENGLRRAVELIQDGVIGDVTEVHVWTNRPIWPQGMEVKMEEKPVPSTLDWKLWLGPTADRPYSDAYLPFKWRGFYDWGTGALGDMACHTANMAFMALNLGYPTSIEAQTAPKPEKAYPAWSIINFQFPARGKMPPVKFVWYDGGKMPPPELSQGAKFPNSGSLLVGKNGTLFSPNDYGAKFVLLPEEKFKGMKEEIAKPPQRLPHGLGDDRGHHQEWIKACKGEGKTMSNFDYAALLTETILLGNVAMRAGEKLEWDGEKMRATNTRSADKYVKNEYLNGYAV